MAGDEAQMMPKRTAGSTVGRGVAETPAAGVDPRVIRSSALFLLIGLIIYIGMYVTAEGLVYEHAERNRFFMVRTAPISEYDFVFLGASRAMPFGFEGVNDSLEDWSGARIINLSMEGAGILPNRLIFDYFLEHHSTHAVVYFLDSFAFYSTEWNEDRLDAQVFRRAPLDVALARTLWNHRWARRHLLTYVSGFPKINAPGTHFEPDRSEAELTRFERVYRANPRIDAQRMAYLYPENVDVASFEKYLEEFDDLARTLVEQGVTFIVIKLPVPERVHELLRYEETFDERMQDLVSRYGLAYYDFSRVSNDDRYFYDTDHLNRDGVMAFSQDYLVPILQQYRAGDGLN